MNLTYAVVGMRGIGIVYVLLMVTQVWSTTFAVLYVFHEKSACRIFLEESPH